MTAGPYAVVVGAVNLDLRGTPERPLVPRDSNPGHVTTSLGGVGRNIAHNMALLGLPVYLITALGEDAGGEEVARSCAALGLDLSHTLRVPGGRTSTYLFITDHRGEMELAVSDMDIYRSLTPGYLAGRLDLLNGARLVVMDANLPAPTVAWLGERCRAPLFVDPVSTAKGEKVRPILDKIHTLKPNRLEAALLSGAKVPPGASPQPMAAALLEAGVERVFLSLGREGVLCGAGGRFLRLDCLPGRMVNATGCGDAFMAALAWAFWEGLDLEETARAGLAAAAIALEGAETINPALSVETLRQRMGCPVPAG